MTDIELKIDHRTPDHSVRITPEIAHQIILLADEHPEPACPSCGVAYIDHLGLNGTCAKLLAITAERDKARVKLREAKADAEAAKAERNGMHVRNYREMQEAIAQRDELAGLLRKHAALACPCCNGHGSSMSGEDVTCRPCDGTGSQYPLEVADALAHLTPTAPTNGEGNKS